MSSYVKQIPNDEVFWIGLVETNLWLGGEKTLVPLSSFTSEVAEALADRLDLQLEVKDDGYVFIQEKAKLFLVQPQGYSKFL